MVRDKSYYVTRNSCKYAPELPADILARSRDAIEAYLAPVRDGHLPQALTR
jgi:hypothetical protein